MAVTQVEPVTNLQRGYGQLFAKLDNGPLILTNRGKAAAVMLSVPDYDRTISRLEQLERAALAAERIATYPEGFIVGEEVDRFFESLEAS